MAVMHQETHTEMQGTRLLAGKHDCKPSSFNIYKKNYVAGNSVNTLVKEYPQYVLVGNTVNRKFSQKKTPPSTFKTSSPLILEGNIE